MLLHVSCFKFNARHANFENKLMFLPIGDSQLRLINVIQVVQVGTPESTPGPRGHLASWTRKR